jgi:hypothetical protein
MHASMPPDALPPDDAGRTEPGDANVVDPAVLAERRVHRAELAEQSAARRAADAQSLAAELAGERARLEAERDAARAEAAAAREGADAVIAEAAHVQAERDALRSALEQARAERDAIRTEMARARSERDAARAEAARAQVEVAPAQAAAAPRERPVPRNGNGAPPAAWASGLRRELAVARTASARTEAAAPPAASPLMLAPSAPPVPGLARERRIAARRAAEPPATVPARERWPERRDDRVAEAPPARAAAEAQPERHADRVAEAPPARAAAEAQPERHADRVAEAPPARAAAAEALSPRRDDRAAPVTALALERERSTRLQAQLEEAAAVQIDLRERLAALGKAVHERREAEQRIEGALQRVREEFDAARRLAADAPPAAEPRPAASAPVVPAAAAPATAAPAATTPATAAGSAPGVDAMRLNAAQARLRAVMPAPAQQSAAPPAGPPTRWLPDALRRLTHEQPETAGRILLGMLPAQHLVATRAFSYDLVLAGRGAVGVDVRAGATTVRTRALARPRSEVDLRIATDAAGLARLLHGRRGLRRRARVRGSRRRLRELRRLAHEPLALRDLARAGATLEPTLAFWLAALAIDSADTCGSRFTIAHAPLAGGPGDAWLRIHDGDPLAVLRTRPSDVPVATLRCTRGALLPLLAGVQPPPGESGTIDGDPDALALLRGWIARTEFATA